jgi:hypothetical protein
MILQCNVHCYAISQEESEDLNLPDPGSWIKFAIDLTEVCAIKQTIDEILDPLYYCTTIYTKVGDTYTVDVPYDSVFNLWTKAKGLKITTHTDKDLEL